MEHWYWGRLWLGSIVFAVAWGLLIGFGSRSWAFGLGAGLLIGGASAVMAERARRKGRRYR